MTDDSRGISHDHGAGLDKRVLQFKPGILIDREMCDEILNRLDSAVGQAQAELFGSRGQAQREAA